MSLLLRKHPAFWIGLLLLGFCGLGLGWDPIAILPWIAVLLFPWITERKWLALLGALFLGILCFIHTSLHIPSGSQKEEVGTGYFRISEIKEEESPFGKTISYQGSLVRFEATSGSVFRHLPCRIYVKHAKDRPKGDRDYLIKGSLLCKNHGRYAIKSKDPWNPIQDSYSFAEWRFVTKQKAKQYLLSHFGHSKVLALFSALALGNVDDRQMASDFRNLGLSHILAISGFHFATVCAVHM